AGDAHAEVTCLARVGAGDRFDVVRPLPARFEHAAPQGEVADGDDVHVAVRAERPDLVRLVDVVLLEGLHEHLSVRRGSPPWSTGSGAARGPRPTGTRG